MGEYTEIEIIRIKKKNQKEKLLHFYFICKRKSKKKRKKGHIIGKLIVCFIIVNFNKKYLFLLYKIEKKNVFNVYEFSCIILSKLWIYLKAQ